MIKKMKAAPHPTIVSGRLFGGRVVYLQDMPGRSKLYLCLRNDVDVVAHPMHASAAPAFRCSRHSDGLSSADCGVHCHTWHNMLLTIDIIFTDKTTISHSISLLQTTTDT